MTEADALVSIADARRALLLKRIGVLVATGVGAYVTPVYLTPTAPLWVSGLVVGVLGAIASTRLRLRVQLPSESGRVFLTISDTTSDADVLACIRKWAEAVHRWEGE